MDIQNLNRGMRKLSDKEASQKTEPFSEKASPKIEFVEITQWNRKDPKKHIKETRTAVFIEGLVAELTERKNKYKQDRRKIINSPIRESRIDSAINELDWFLVLLGVEAENRK